VTTQETDSSTARPLAVVTGASTGIGRALADELASRGFDLVIAADEDRIATAARELSPGAGVTAVQVDLSTAGGVEELHRRVRELGRPVAVAALNAGIAANGRFDRSSLADDLRVVDLNVRSVVHLAKLLVRDMLAAGEGRLLVTSSIAAVAPGPYQATYSASKAFVHSFAVAIGHELKGTGVTVTSLMPGPTDTDFFARADMEDDTRLGRSGHKDDPAEVAKDAVDALLEGRSSVVAGSFANRIQAELGTHLPDALAAPLLARMSRPDDE
jgi:short-subunit dehydrogenase